MNRKLAFGLIIPVAALMCACSEEGSEVTEIIDPVEISFSWWGNDARHEYTIEAISQFEELHPEIRVTCNYTEWSGYQTRSDIEMNSGTEADVMQINYAWIEQYSPDGDGYYDLNKVKDTIDLSGFDDYSLSFGMKNDKLNALPIAMNTNTVYINKTIYDQYGLELPKTWEDYFEAAKVMKKENYPISMNAKPAFFFITSYVEQLTGKRFMEEDGTLNFTEEDFAAMLEFYCRLINEGVMPQVEYFDRSNIDSGVYAGTLAWISDGTSYCGTAEEAGYEIVPADYPAADGAKSGDGWYAKPATMYAMSKNTDHPEEAAMLMDFLLNSAEMANLQGTEKGIPISESARKTLDENGQLTGIQYEAYEKMEEYDSLEVLSPYFENDDLIDVFRESCNLVLFDKSTSYMEAQNLYKAFSEALGSTKE